MEHPCRQRVDAVDRASLIPVPRTVSDRYAPQFLERAKRFQIEFWETRSGPAEPA